MRPSERAFKRYGIELRPVVPSDLPSLRRWRNHPRVAQQMVDQRHISPRQQRLWYQGLCTRDDQAHWTVWYHGTRTGYLNIKGDGPLDEQPVVDVGMYVAQPPAPYVLLGLAMAMLQLDVVFEVVGAAEVRMAVKESNESAVRFNQQLGYREEGRSAGFVQFSMAAEQWPPARNRFLRYFQPAGR